MLEQKWSYGEINHWNDVQPHLQTCPFSQSITFGLTELVNCLQTNATKFQSHDSYLTLGFFLEGIPQNIPLDNFFRGFQKNGADFLNELQSSFRITNVQNAVPQIRSMCIELSALHKSAITCNLYFTPGTDLNCFEYHSDHSDSFILQTLGTKRWTFPIKDGAYLKEVGSDQFSFLEDPFFKTYERHEIQIKPGDFMKIPYAFVHKARIEDRSPSIHLNFSKYYPSHKDFVNFAIHHLIGQLDGSSNEKLSEENLIVFAKEFKLKSESLIEKFQISQLKKEQGLMAKGLVYKPILATTN